MTVIFIILGVILCLVGLVILFFFLRLVYFIYKLKQKSKEYMKINTEKLFKEHVKNLSDLYVFKNNLNR
jgi:uncharacterized membrane protein